MQPSLCSIKREKSLDPVFTCEAKHLMNVCVHHRPNKRNHCTTLVLLRLCPWCQGWTDSILCLQYSLRFLFKTEKRPKCVPGSTFCDTLLLLAGLSDYLKSLYGWIIQKPADFTRSLSCSTALSLPSIRSENLLTPGWSIAPNCRCMKPAWYSRSSSGMICSVPSSLMKPGWSKADACPVAPLSPQVARCWAAGPSSKLSLTPTSAAGMSRCCSAGSDPGGCLPVMEEMLPRKKRQSPFKLVLTVTSLSRSSLLASSMLLQLLAGDGEDKCFSRILFLLVSLSPLSPSSTTKAFCPMFCGRL